MTLFNFEENISEIILKLSNSDTFQSLAHGTIMGLGDSVVKCHLMVPKKLRCYRYCRNPPLALNLN